MSQITDPSVFKIGMKALVTTDNWFIAPNGENYRAAFGTVRAIRNDEQSLGIRTNAKSTNWYLELGNMLIAGCQIHYVIATPTAITTGSIKTWKETQGGANEYERPTSIYNADQDASA